jgi:four helix bundle protein
MRFMELIAWQKARSLTKEVYRATQNNGFRHDFGLTSQIQRAAVSVMSNIAEGHERDGSAEFHRFLHMAKGSCAEVRSQLYVAYDAGYLAKVEFDSLLALAEEVSRIIGGLRLVIKKRKNQAVCMKSTDASLVPPPSSLVPSAP